MQCQQQWSQYLISSANFVPTDFSLFQNNEFSLWHLKLSQRYVPLSDFSGSASLLPSYLSACRPFWCLPIPHVTTCVKILGLQNISGVGVLAALRAWGEEAHGNAVADPLGCVVSPQVRGARAAVRHVYVHACVSLVWQGGLSGHEARGSLFKLSKASRAAQQKLISCAHFASECPAMCATKLHPAGGGTGGAEFI
jgi:hypothetical protein